MRFPKFPEFFSRAYKAEGSKAFLRRIALANALEFKINKNTRDKEIRENSENGYFGKGAAKWCRTMHDYHFQRMTEVIDVWSQISIV